VVRKPRRNHKDVEYALSSAIKRCTAPRRQTLIISFALPGQRWPWANKMSLSRVLVLGLEVGSVTANASAALFVLVRIELRIESSPHEPFATMRTLVNIDRTARQVFRLSHLQGSGRARCCRSNAYRALRGQFDFIARHERLICRPGTTHSIYPITSMFPSLHTKGMEYDISLARSSQRIGLDAPRRALIVQLDTEMV
jgi:hypothetical protein